MHPNHIARPIVRAALDRKTITYSELGIALGRGSSKMPGRGWGNDLRGLEVWCDNSKLPPLTVCVFAKNTGRPAPDGTYKGVKYADMDDARIEGLQKDVFDYPWKKHAAVFGLEDH